MTINVSEALDSDTAEVVTVERTTVGSYVNGLYVAGSSSAFKALASPQQPSPTQLQILPEGERDKEIMLFICNKPVMTSDDENGLPADVIIRKGKRYKVISAGDWNSFGHTMAMGAKVQ